MGHLDYHPWFHCQNPLSWMESKMGQRNKVNISFCSGWISNKSKDSVFASSIVQFSLETYEVSIQESYK